MSVDVKAASETSETNLKRTQDLARGFWHYRLFRAAKWERSKIVCVSMGLIHLLLGRISESHGLLFVRTLGINGFRMIGVA
jgi:hypothetical protein